MAVEEWIEEAKKKPRTRRSTRTLRKLSDDKASPIEVVEALAERLDDRLAYHEQRLVRGEKVLLNMVALTELRQMLYLLVAQVHHWKEEVWPKASAGILATKALSTFTDYRLMYEASERKYRDLVKFMATNKSLMSEEQVERMLSRMEERQRECVTNKN